LRRSSRRASTDGGSPTSPWRRSEHESRSAMDGASDLGIVTGAFAVYALSG
jgi:hypothetical protein